MSSSAIIEFMQKEKARGKAVLYSTHYMEEAEMLCDRIVMLSYGRVIAQGMLAEIYAQTGCENLRSAFRTLMAQENDDQTGRMEE